jgi:CO/xanthine dehydrogenase Mo-binding subunit
MTSFYYEPPSVHQDKGFKGDVSAAYAWATQVVEVEVDTDTGIVRLLKVTGAHDVGRVLNRSASKARSRAASSWARATR